MTTTARRTTALVLATLALLGLTGCAAMGSSESSSVDGGGGLPAVAAPADQEAAGPDDAVVITGRISIVTDDPIAAATEATTIVADAGGRVSGRSEHAGEGGGQAEAQLTLRIPADALDDVRTALAVLGSVRETTMESGEVGGTQRDLDARITTLRASIARYTDWLGTAEKTSDLIELESAIAERQTELEGLESQAGDLADLVPMSTVTLSLFSEYVPVDQAPKDLGAAIALGWGGFLSFWSAVGIGLGVGLPWLVLFAGIAVVVVLLVRRARRRAASRTAQTPATPDALLFEVPAAPQPPL